MKGFIAFLCLIAVAVAAPEYNYAQPPHYAPSALYNAPHAPELSHHQNVYHDHHQQPIVTKHFFLHSAAEEHDEVGADKIIHLGPGRKHYRVVFIKAPHQNVQTGRIRVVAPANEEKTVIYVLSKKTEASDIHAEVQQAHSEPSKPEVHFIKYKTHEEAAHAQQQIQAQYDSLGGSSVISNEGVAPLTSVVGSLGHTASDEESHSHSGHQTVVAVTPAYLPPHH